MDAVDGFQRHRPRLFAIAYRMLGSASDAEDVVQDAWVRYSTAAPADVRSLQGWLTTVVTRLCLDRLKSARATREQYVGPWLPEPVLTADEERPDAMLQRHESVTLAFLVLLDTLSPEERAVFLLHDVFDYSHDEVAGMLDISAAASRQVLHRAKERIAAGRPRFGGDPEAKRALARRFVAAMSDGDPDGLASLLADDVKFWADGGGKVATARRPLFGREAVLNLLLGFHRLVTTQGLLPAVSIEVMDVNFDPAVIVRIAGRLDSVYVLAVEDDAIAAFRVVRNPDKMAFIERQLAART